MLRNQATDLLRYEHLTTTAARAKELRPFVERLITIAKRGVAGGDGVRALNARRLVLRDVQDREVVSKLFDTLAPRFETRPGGYTRLLRLGFRKGDAAEVAQVELVGSEYNPKAKTDADAGKSDAPPKAKGVGGRLKAAADRLRGKSDKSEAASAAPAATPKAGKAKGGAKGKAKKASKED